MRRRTKVIGLCVGGFVSMAAVAIFLFVRFITPVCVISEEETAVSPDGRYAASEIMRDCGATDGSFWLAIRKRGKPIDQDDTNAVFYYRLRMRELSFRWLDARTLLVKYEDSLEPDDPDFAFLNSFHNRDRWNDVRVVYEIKKTGTKEKVDREKPHRALKSSPMKIKLRTGKS